MIVQAIEDLIADLCPPAVVRAIEGGDSPQALWDAIAQAGFLELLRPEAEGGAGLSLAELYPVLHGLGRHVVPLPLADALAARGVVAPGVALPQGLLSLAPHLVQDAAGTLTAALLPFGLITQQVLAVRDGALVLLAAADALRQPTDIPHSLCATLRWPAGAKGLTVAGRPEDLLPMTAAVHAAVAAGAMSRLFEMTLRYSNERSQFGRTLGKFQSVQHLLAVMAEQVAAAGMAAQAAFAGPGAAPSLLRAAIAQARVSEAAPQLADAAHALHGAIGVTEAYDLQLYSRRLHESRRWHGSESHWQRVVGEQLLAAPSTLADFIRAA